MRIKPDWNAGTTAGTSFTLNGSTCTTG